MIDSITQQSYLFIYGITSGIFFAAGIYMLFYAFQQILINKQISMHWHFFLSAMMAFSFGLFNIYCISVHFPVEKGVFPSWLLWLGKLIAPVAMYISFRMYIQKIPIKTLQAFNFWERTKSLFYVLHAAFLSIFIVFLCVDNPRVIILICFFIVNLIGILALLFGRNTYATSMFSGIYITSGVLGVLIVAILLDAFSFLDMDQISPKIFLYIHIFMSLLVMLFIFIFSRYSHDESTPMYPLAKYKIRDLYKNVYYALKKNEFFLVYQPKISVKTQEVCGLEALIRWQHPKKGLIPPSEFIPLAEKTELIKDICQWVVTQVVEDLKGLKNKDIHIPISINFSVHNLNFDNVNYLVSSLREHNLSTDMVMVEITESVFLDMSTEQKQALQILKDAGVKLSLDDFGSGYSSFRYIDEVGLSEVKLDRLFCDRMISDNKNSLVESLILLCHSLDVTIVVEGVNESKVFYLLKEMGCNEAQGFGIAKPMSLDLLPKWLKEYSIAF